MKRHTTRIHVLFWLVSAILLLSSACQDNIRQEEFPDLPIPVEELNTQVSVFAPSGANTFQINDDIFVAVKVIGEDTLIFPPDFGAVVYRYEDKEWTKVEGIPVTYRHGDWIIPPGLDGSDWVSPKPLKFSHTVLLRIFVFGHVYRDGKATDEMVGAYVDVVLRP
jgi:hypothetical protein